MQRPTTIYTDRDDALHPYNSPDYSEWWYLDCRFDNGYSCVLTWHWLNQFIKPHIPTIQIFTYTPEGKRYVGMEAIDPKACFASEDICDVKMGSSYLKQEGKLYKMAMHSKGIGCELTFEGTVPGWKFGDGLMVGADKSDIVAGWVIACPRAKVYGKLFIKDQVIEVKGNGYHDHNWGNKDLYDIFKGWYWGRLNDPKYTIIYSNTQILDGSWMPSLYIADDKSTLLATHQYDFAVEKEDAEPKTGDKYPKIISLKYDSNDLKLNCRLDTKSIAEHNPLPKLNEFNMFNWRFLADYEGDITVDGKRESIKGETISERFIFR
jgi:predicted secreted hydrolase